MLTCAATKLIEQDYIIMQQCFCSFILHVASCLLCFTYNLVKTLCCAVHHVPQQLTLPAHAVQIVAYDFGCKNNILRRLASFGCKVTVVPADYPAKKVMELNPDGIFLSNGPVRFPPALGLPCPDLPLAMSSSPPPLPLPLLQAT